MASIKVLAWYPYPTLDDPDLYKEHRDEADDISKSKVLLKQPLLISTELYEEVFNVTFFPPQKKYTIAYGTRHIIAEIDNFDRSTPQNHHNEDYSLQIFEEIYLNVDPVFLISICIAIDYIEWPYIICLQLMFHQWRSQVF